VYHVRVGRYDIHGVVVQSSLTLVEAYISEVEVVEVGLGQFHFGQDVELMNFKNAREIVASGKISGVWGVDKFHFKPIPQFFYKVDVTHALIPDAPLMHPHEAGDQFLVKDVVGSSVLWSQKHMKS
jgi:hypothetical protein